MSRLGGRRGNSNQESSWHEVWGVWKTPAFSDRNIAEKTLFIDLTLRENGNCEENGSLTVVTCWHLHVYPFFSIFSAGDRFVLNWWKNASHSSIRTKNPLPNTRFKVSGKLQLSQLSTLPRRHYSLTWPFANLETVKRMVVSQWSLADTCMCVFLLNSIGGRMSHQLATWAEHWTRANICPFSMAKFVQCISMLCSFWLGTGTGNVIPGSDRIPASRHTAVSETKPSSQHTVWGVQKTTDFSAFNIAKETLFIDLTLFESGNCEENGCLTMVTWLLADTCMCVFLLNWIGGRMSHQLAIWAEP